MSALLAAPWHISQFEILSGGKDRVVMGADSFSIARVSGRSEAEHIAIANMLIAAPDLLRCAQILAALDSGRGRTFPTVEDCAFARAAISRATPTAEGVA